MALSYKGHTKDQFSLSLKDCLPLLCLGKEGYLYLAPTLSCNSQLLLHKVSFPGPLKVTTPLAEDLGSSLMDCGFNVAVLLSPERSLWRGQTTEVRPQFSLSLT